MTWYRIPIATEVEMMMNKVEFEKTTIEEAVGFMNPPRVAYYIVYGRVESAVASVNFNSKSRQNVKLWQLKLAGKTFRFVCQEFSREAILLKRHSVHELKILNLHSEVWLRAQPS